MGIGKLAVTGLLCTQLFMGLANAEGVGAKHTTNQSDNVVLVSNAHAAVTRADFDFETSPVPMLL